MTNPSICLNSEESLSLMTYMMTIRHKHARMWRVSIYLMHDLGLRVGELVRLRWSDCLIPGPEGHWMVGPHLSIRAETTKGHRPRTLPIPTSTRGVLTDLMLERVSRIETNVDDLIVPLTTRAVRLLCDRVGLAALGRPIHPHLLRHTFGTRVLRVSNIRVAQLLLGHASISTTQIYTHPTTDDVAAAAEKACIQPEDLIV